ncbi:MAG: polymer-forming cytoskeletal protein [Sterolibacterium sp.]|jgi:cytoskeletal protein CcmA (bactofilin family)
MSKTARYAQSRTDTLIGAGMHVHGQMDFTGVLRVQGAVLGSIACDGDSNGTIVVGKSGNVTGTINAPYVVVGGRVDGPVSSSETIEIQQGACLIGDADYRAIEIQLGGIIEGELKPRMPIDGERARQEPDSNIPAPPSLGERRIPPGGGYWRRLKGRRKLGVGVALLAAMTTAVLVYRGSTPVVPPETDVVLRAESSMQAAAPAPTVAAGSGESKDGPKETAGHAVVVAPGSDPDASRDLRVPPAALAETDAEAPQIVQGVNPGKPAGVFSVICKEASVLIRKRRLDPGEGTRIEIARGATENVAFAENEIFRVAQGRNLIIFYQGRKVAPKTIESGAWMSFVPHPPAGASDKR